MKMLAAAFLLLALTAGADSLWTPDFEGYLGTGPRLQEGDTVTVTFNEGFSLSFKATGTDSKRITLQISGGPYGDLLSFLPAASAEGNRSVAGDSQATFKGSLAARVSAASAGVLTLQASRTLTVDGREESVELNATVNARDVSQNRTVDFSRLVEPRLVYRGPTEPAGDILRSGDLLVLPGAPATAAAGADTAAGTAPAAAQPGAGAPQPAPGAAAAAPGQPQPATAAAVPPPPTRYQLTQARQRELLLRYLNRIVDILF